ncbi:AzlD domain-containing protein [Periweissella fabalis]|uniref:AzlD domain-containing protein n=1 Tax=Periweissella fabalis TaxID=1070421 RepID=A0A7X6S3E0_9LACO|nr:AzlD domain-containing protein [Periweissella fabalis]MCM0599577.1 AzlD domain-containing protein [Periweissella fabalis]NKZ23882.1 AzlD domain-containing protein [Periweissella fabalis]
MDAETKRHLMIVFFGMVAALIPRYFPMLFFTTRKVPTWFNEWMNYMPVALFTSLIAKDLFVDHSYHMTFTNYNMYLAALIVVIFAYYTRSMFLSVMVGLLSVWGFALLLAAM